MKTNHKYPKRQLLWIGPEHTFIRDDLETGWRVLLFGILLYASKSLFGAWLTAIPFSQRPLRSMAGGAITPSGLLVLEFRNLASAALSAFILMRLEHRTLPRFGFDPSDAFRSRFWKGIALGLGSTFVLYVLLRAEGVFSLGHIDLSKPKIPLYAGSWFVACVLVGVYEEFVFRGYVLHTLRDGMRFWPAALLSSTLFGLVHLGNGNDPWYIAVSAATFGMLYCFSVLRTGTIWLAIGIHAAFDFSETFLFSPSGGLDVRGHLFDSAIHGPVWLTGGVAGPEASVNGILVFVMLFLVVQRLGPSSCRPAETEDGMSSAPTL